MLFGKPRRILQRLMYIIYLKIRVHLHDLGSRHAAGNQIYNESDRYPHSSDTGAATHDVRVERDAVEALHVVLIYRLPAKSNLNDDRTEEVAFLPP